MKKLCLFFCVLFFSFAVKAEGISVIRDTEIENTIKLISEPIFRAANIPSKNVRIIIINDESINAFVSGGMNIFINTGLITKSEDPLMLMGVIAHETGHITGGHLVRKKEEYEKATFNTVLSYILGAAAIASGSTDAGQAILSSGSHIAGRQALQYSRSQEESADQAGLKYLEESGFSARGLLEVLQYLNSQERVMFDKLNPYAMTHPLSAERLDFIRGSLDKSKFSESNPPEQIKKAFARSVAKARAFLNPIEYTFSDYPESSNSVEARYARAIAHFKKPDIEKALIEIDSLIKEFPKDPYFYELKGQFLFENGRIDESIPMYQKANDLLPNSPLVKIGLASSLISKGDDKNLRKAVQNLEQALVLENRNVIAWRQLATAYGKLGNKGMSNLALAEEALASGEKEEAEKFAKIAKKELPKNSPSLLRIEDIISSADEKDKR